MPKLNKKYNSDKTQKPKFWQNSTSDKTLSLLVRATWDLDNQWDVLWAVFCDSRDVFVRSPKKFKL